MTDKLKPVQSPRVILIQCKNSKRISEIISDILNCCSYNTLVDCFATNADFIISVNKNNINKDADVIKNTIFFDDGSIDEKLSNEFCNKVMSYECCLKNYGDIPKEIMTYSSENYKANITARNIIKTKNNISFDVIGQGILSRVRIYSNKYSVEDVLICTAVLVATGMSIASILGYFNT